jgi:AcrR family transcriptional regulator
VAAILEASVRILRTEGRTAFNTNRIAEVAGVSIGTLYGYFPDKDSICIALARQILDEDRRSLIEAVG